MSNAAARSAHDGLLFLSRLISRPRSIGAIAPSSPALANKIAAQIDPANHGVVLELGPGTGVVTEALIARGVPYDRLIAVEFDPDLARFMRERFPRLRVIEGDAFRLDRTLPPEKTGPLAGVVCGLPLLNFPPAQRRTLITSALARMPSGGPLVQFSYGFTPPVPADEEITVERAGLVLANLPPARVWVYRRI
ncbi:MAG TPA: rRNA adenine N-6-methyltransferase family protein [Rhizomicrobium sp.]|jgi:phosphatidylethanolamine/phosphatidyl-N-methylethanolamine N-methyltransferase|nr:rRNA adenine N-6-methyltransferase family protein [Rhizomicrobium sp.]